MSKDTTDEIFQKYVTKLLEELSSNDDFSVILKGQLHIESYLNTMLESVSLNINDLELDRIMFARKVKLCSSFGIIHNDVKPTLIKLANIRNKFAHELWHSVSEKDIKDFENTFLSCPLFHNNDGPEIQIKSKLGRMIYYIWIYLYKQLLNLLESREELFKFWYKQINYTHESENVIVLNFISKLQ